MTKGDTVQLNSGSPIMTIKEVKTVIQVTWLDDSFMVQTADFDTRCVKLLSEVK